VLTADGKIIIGTDHGEYYDWIKDEVRRMKDEVKLDMKEFLDSSFIPHPSSLETRYKKKDMFGAKITRYIVLTKSTVIPA
jgi:tRNA G46 methylase TrmB